ncbi:hypothetical protein [Aeromicrobium sp. P5_D10]
MVMDDGESVMGEGMPAAEFLLMERILQQECAEVDRPHVVICRVPGTGVVSYQGPFATGMDAMIAADREAAVEGSSDDAAEFSVAPLHPFDGPVSA